VGADSGRFRNAEGSESARWPAGTGRRGRGSDTQEELTTFCFSSGGRKREETPEEDTVGGFSPIIGGRPFGEGPGLEGSIFFVPRGIR